MCVCVACLGRCALRVWGGVRCVALERCALRVWGGVRVALLGRCALRAVSLKLSHGASSHDTHEPCVTLLDPMAPPTRVIPKR